MSQRTKLQHPSRAILVHIPTATLDQRDVAARSGSMTRSELIRELLKAPINIGPRKRAEEAKKEIADQRFQRAWTNLKLG